MKSFKSARRLGNNQKTHGEWGPGLPRPAAAFSAVFEHVVRSCGCNSCCGWKAHKIALFAFSNVAERGLAAEDMRWLCGPRTLMIPKFVHYFRDNGSWLR